MIGDYFRFSLNGLKVRRLRSILTMIGIFIGIAAVVALISLSMGMQEAVEDLFEKAGSDKITVLPGGQQFGPPGSGTGLITAKLTEDDVDVVKKVRGMKTATGLLTRTTQAEFKDQVEFVNVWGFPTGSDELKSLEGQAFFEINEGRELDTGDRYVGVIGIKIATEKFDEEIDIGDKIEFKGKDFKVIGIQKPTGTPMYDELIRIPMDVARDVFNVTEEVSFIGGQVEKGFDVGKVAEDIKKSLRKHRDVDEGEEDFAVETPESIIAAFKNVLGIIQAILVGIAAISLLVGGIGIMNTMYTSVLERTRQIGIMKSIGARNMDIFFIFFIESGLLGIAGGIIGVALGLGLAKATEIIAIQMGAPEIFQASLSPIIIVGALLFSFVVGALSGVLPAIQASKMNPVEAMRKR